MNNRLRDGGSFIPLIEYPPLSDDENPNDDYHPIQPLDREYSSFEFPSMLPNTNP